MTKNESPRRLLSSWQLWTGVAYFGLVAVVFALYVQNARINTESSRRLAQMEAVAEATYDQCLASRPQIARIDAFLAGVQGLGSALLENARAAHTTVPKSSPLYEIQRDNIRRLEQSVRLIGNLRFPIPTPATCSARRAKALNG